MTFILHFILRKRISKVLGIASVNKGGITQFYLPPSRVLSLYSRATVHHCTLKY